MKNYNKFNIIFITLFFLIPSLVNANILTFNQEYININKPNFYEVNISNNEPSKIFSYIYYFPLKEDNTFFIDTDSFNIYGRVTTSFLHTYISVNYTDLTNNKQFNYTYSQIKFFNTFYGNDFCWGKFLFTTDINQPFENIRLRSSCGLYAGLSSTSYENFNYTFAYPNKLNITSSSRNNLLKLAYVPSSSIENTILEAIAKTKDTSILSKIPYGLGDVIFAFINTLNYTMSIFYFVATHPYLLILIFWTLIIPIAIVRSKDFFSLIYEILKLNGAMISFIINIIFKMFKGAIDIVKAIIDLLPW